MEMPLPSCRVEPFMNGNHEPLGRLESQTGQGRVPKRTTGPVGCGADEDFCPALGSNMMIFDGHCLYPKWTQTCGAEGKLPVHFVSSNYLEIGSGDGG